MEPDRKKVVQNTPVPFASKNMETDFEDALNIAGVGKYQYAHGTLMVATLSAALLEMIGCSFVLPAAACDLNLSSYLKGIIASIPNIGVILTAPLWGRAADSMGRKPILLVSTFGAGVFGVLASFMPSLYSFALCKLAGSFFLSCPSSLCYAYTGEVVPLKRRDTALLICNAFLMLSASFSPILGWSILSNDWNIIKPWRLLTAAYALPLILVSLCVTQAKESPKFLIAKGRYDEALQVLKHIYSVNSGLDRENYSVTSLKRTVRGNEREAHSESHIARSGGHESILSLLRPPHLKWLTLLGFLIFALFSLLNGLYLFTPDTINKLLSQSTSANDSTCQVINLSENKTNNTACIGSISHGTFEIMLVTTMVYGMLVMMISLSPITKKTQLITMFALVSVACIVAELSMNRLVAGIAMSAMQVTALGIGPLTAYAVHLFPTTLRGTAVGAILMFGRIGSVVGANVGGIFLTTLCAATFYGFSSLLFLCALLSFFLPNHHPSNDNR